MYLFQLGGFDLFRPEECHEPGRDGEDIATNKVGRTYVHKCLRHLSLSSPAACFAFNTSSMRRPIAASESFKMATLSSRGMSSPDNLSCFYSIHQKRNLNSREQPTNCFLTGRNSSFVAVSSIEGLKKRCSVECHTSYMGIKTYHSSEDSESVKVGVGRRLRFFELPSSIEATASLSARRFMLLT